MKNNRKIGNAEKKNRSNDPSKPRPNIILNKSSAKKIPIDVNSTPVLKKASVTNKVNLDKNFKNPIVKEYQKEDPVEVVFENISEISKRHSYDEQRLKSNFIRYSVDNKLITYENEEIRLLIKDYIWLSDLITDHVKIYNMYQSKSRDLIGNSNDDNEDDKIPDLIDVSKNATNFDTSKNESQYLDLESISNLVIPSNLFPLAPEPEFDYFDFVSNRTNSAKKPFIPDVKDDVFTKSKKPSKGKVLDNEGFILKSSKSRFYHDQEMKLEDQHKKDKEKAIKEKMELNRAKQINQNMLKKLEDDKKTDAEKAKLKKEKEQRDMMNKRNRNIKKCVNIPNKLKFKNQYELMVNENENVNSLPFKAVDIDTQMDQYKKCDSIIEKENLFIEDSDDIKIALMEQRKLAKEIEHSKDYIDVQLSYLNNSLNLLQERSNSLIRYELLKSLYLVSYNLTQSLEFHSKFEFCKMISCYYKSNLTKSDQNNLSEVLGVNKSLDDFCNHLTNSFLDLMSKCKTVSIKSIVDFIELRLIGYLSDKIISGGQEYDNIEVFFQRISKINAMQYIHDKLDRLNQLTKDEKLSEVGYISYDQDRSDCEAYKKYEEKHEKRKDIKIRSLNDSIKRNKFVLREEFEKEIKINIILSKRRMKTDSDEYLCSKKILKFVFAVFNVNVSSEIADIKTSDVNILKSVITQY